MTGIERLRQMAEDFRSVRVSGRTSFIVNTWRDQFLEDAIDSIADQIERERACDSDTAENVSLVVGGVVAEMELLLSGHEVRGNNPVSRWSRELREALDAGHDHAKDVSVIAYDLLPQEDREAIALVRDHGGIEVLRRMFQDADSRRVELCGALGIDLDKGWSEAMAAMRLRLMPDGMEWPRYESGEPVRIGDAIVDGLGHAHEVSSVEVFDDAEALHWSPSEPEDFVWLVHGERVKRPAPKVLDADGVEIRVGDTVCGTRDMEPMRVVDTDSRECGFKHIKCEKEGDGFFFYWADELTHKLSILAADGRPLRVGETVFNERGDKFTVSKVDHERGVFSATAAFDGREGIDLSPVYFSHEHTEHKRRPEIDSCERLEEDARNIRTAMLDSDKLPFEVIDERALDLVRRAKALAERERGE